MHLTDLGTFPNFKIVSCIVVAITIISIKFASIYSEIHEKTGQWISFSNIQQKSSVFIHCFNTSDLMSWSLILSTRKFSKDFDMFANVFLYCDSNIVIVCYYVYVMSIKLSKLSACLVKLFGNRFIAIISFH